ncbi:MAG: PIN domain-containing protein [Wenzhouxiangella sp.]
MPVERFIDTNVLVHHIDDSDPRKTDIAHDILRDAIATGNACISFQVVQEFLNVMLRKAERPLSPEQAQSYLAEVLSPLCRIFASIPLYQNAIDLQARYRFGFNDSLIVAAALSAGCRELLTEDLQHGQRIENLTIRNPFA